MSGFLFPLPLRPRFTAEELRELSEAGCGGWYIRPAGSRHPIEAEELDPAAVRNARCDVIDPATGDRYRVSYRAPLPERKKARR
jgi:hypothetical protein